ncbi:NUDIX domain-containing protein [Ornithinibacillus halotolerans]|uniref:DNA mismatch repair protein MutT n=1 Tax=Ornithinibacillus halotolerans TaxID=1274357 RepID=A0A916S658_9BACI|nr:NUDIX domain-containing protein [Ornithinibacillus halotolerans]GGA86430.1 DNA mismatch repair protein MutT [Ornithinibacillus halotolerans]
MDIRKIVKTAGAYVIYNECFIFQVGPTKDGSKLGVVRLGGHTEDYENSLDTAKREVLEEAAVNFAPINAPTTYYLNNWADEPSHVEVQDPIRPLLIKGNEKESYTVMYIGYSDAEPFPSSETSGLLFLSPEDILHICSRRLTLKEFTKHGGRAVLKEKVDEKLLLEAFPQLQFLSRLIKKESEWINSLLAK